MKKFLALFLLVCSLSKAQTYSISPAKTVTFSAAFYSVTINDIYMVKTTGSTLSVTWERVSMNLPTGWDYSICDLGTCHPGLPAGPITMNTSTSTTAESFLGLNIDPANIVGTGTVVMRVYQTGFPSNADTLTWIINAGPTGVKENLLATKLNVYPNPATNVLNIDAIDLKISKATIKTIIGTEVMQLDLTSDNTSIDISSLPEGIYLLTIESVDGKVTKRIIKD